MSTVVEKLKATYTSVLSQVDLFIQNESPTKEAEVIKRWIADVKAKFEESNKLMESAIDTIGEAEKLIEKK